MNLRETLRFAKDVGVRDRDHIHRSVEVGGLHLHVARLHLDQLFRQVSRVQPVQYFQHPRHRIVQPRVDRGEHHHALLDQCERGADGLVGVLVGEFFECGLHHTFARINQEPEQTEQHRRRLIERDRHRDLAHIVHVDAAFNLDDLRGHQVQSLPIGAAFELEHGGYVLNMRRV